MKGMQVAATNRSSLGSNRKTRQGADDKRCRSELLTQEAMANIAAETGKPLDIVRREAATARAKLKAAVLTPKGESPAPAAKATKKPPANPKRKPLTLDAPAFRPPLISTWEPKPYVDGQPREIWAALQILKDAEDFEDAAFVARLVPVEYRRRLFESMCGEPYPGYSLAAVEALVG
jgi:hypothetical protein